MFKNQNHLEKMLNIKTFLVINFLQNYIDCHCLLFTTLSVALFLLIILYRQHFYTKS